MILPTANGATLETRSSFEPRKFTHAAWEYKAIPAAGLPIFILTVDNTEFPGRVTLAYALLSRESESQKPSFITNQAGVKKCH
jgi:hypothetical protein